MRPSASLSSEAVAVGDRGEVARYKPARAGCRKACSAPVDSAETPRLRAVAWPTPSVSTPSAISAQMWLWRGETGLWEIDPATPLNFRGNLLGIAFDPEDTSRGYAVGQAGVLLRYGKTWTQGAGRRRSRRRRRPRASPRSRSPARRRSSRIANSSPAVPRNTKAGCSSTTAPAGASTPARLPRSAKPSAPWAVAGLPDGGAAFTTEGRAGVRARIRRRPLAGDADPVPRRRLAGVDSPCSAKAGRYV